MIIIGFRQRKWGLSKRNRHVYVELLFCYGGVEMQTLAVMISRELLANWVN
jgi:hypothetical protein